MTVNGGVVPALCGRVLTRNRCPSFVTAYAWLALTTPAGKRAFGNPAAKASVASIGTAIIVPAASR